MSGRNIPGIIKNALFRESLSEELGFMDKNDSCNVKREKELWESQKGNFVESSFD